MTVLSDTKMSDASAGVTPMDVTVQGVSVYTQMFENGSAWLNLACTDANDQWPRLSDTVTVQLILGASGCAVGSVQGTVEYDPEVLELESAAFTDTAEAAAFTKSLNTAKKGEIPFVYAAMEGCPQAALVGMRFKVIGGLNGYSEIKLTNTKATNAETTHLEWMECWANGLSIYPQAGNRQVLYTLALAPDVKCTDEVITVHLHAEGAKLGGMQGMLEYDASQLEYVQGSAAFTGQFAQNADVKMINDAQVDQIQLVYANTAGVEPDGSVIFTAMFRFLGTEENLSR